MILTGFQTGHAAQSPCLTQPWSLGAHMGAIICKVAAVAPGNDLKGACVHLCACVCLVMCSVHECIYSPLSHPPISSKWRGKSAPCRRGDTGRLLCCLNPKLSRPPFSPWKRIIFSSIVKHLSEMFTHARTHTHLSHFGCAVKPCHMCLPWQ